MLSRGSVFATISRLINPPEALGGVLYMRKVGTIIAVILAVALVVAAGYFVFNLLNPKSAGVLVETTPASLVFINNEQVGRTPYEGTHKPEEVVIKLVPESFETPLAPYETKVVLVSGIKTVIRRDFGQTEGESSGVIVSYDKEGGGKASVAVISDPDAAQVVIDGSIEGFTPHKSPNVSEGEHTITVKAAGFIEQSVKVQTHKNYKLTAIFKLAPDPNFEEEKEEEEDKENEKEEKEEEEEVNKVKILPTGVGFLRVRSNPGIGSEEVGQVNPGETYVYLSIDEDTGWYEIEYEEEETGWVSGDYVEELESEQEE